MRDEGAATTAALLSLAGVHTHVGRYHILHGVDLAVRPGAVTVLLGRNGAGKTTTLRTVMGLWRASAGRIAFDGATITNEETAGIARRGIAYVPETMGIFGQLSVHENLLLACHHRLEPARLDRVVALFPAVGAKLRQRAGTLSGGQKQMVAIARALIEPRRLLVVDEPTKGLAPSVVGDLIDAFLALRQERATILLVEQNFQMAREVGDDVAVMDDGRVVHTGSMAGLVADEALQHRLLGLGMAMHQ